MDPCNILTMNSATALMPSHNTAGDLLQAELERAGAKAFVFGTPVISDGQGQGNEGV
jgi:dihydroxyacid dehydratase/phosphogluconate dehydratase